MPSAGDESSKVLQQESGFFFLLPRVKFGSFLEVFRFLNSSLCAIEEYFFCFGEEPEELVYGRDFSFREYQFSAKRHLQNRQKELH